jgi:hypothetical protein
MTAVLHLPEPYDFVRFITGSLAAVWTVRGGLTTWRLLRRAERALGPDRAERAWLRRVVLLAVVRTTVLDPVNLALMLVLIGLWTVHL